MTCLYTLLIHYANGSTDKFPFDQYHAVRDCYQHCISYSGDRVRRVEVVDHYGNLRTIWDINWTAGSKAQRGYNHDHHAQSLGF